MTITETTTVTRKRAASASGPRFDQLTPNTPVLIRTAGRDDFEHALFLGVHGTGDTRVATFAQADRDGDVFEWEAYRFEGRWCYGTDAARLELIASWTDPRTFQDES